MNDTMKAALYDSFGGPEVLYIGTVPVPEPKADEVLVQVRALSVNGGETAARSGKYAELFGDNFPQRIGLDLVGVAVKLGDDVTDLAVGDRVWGVLGAASGFGSAAEFVAVPAERLGIVPESLGMVEAASLPMGTTAITALVEKAELIPGESLLVRGASGGVGNIAVQLGSAHGAEVTALTGEDTLDFVRELGAHHAYDFRTVKLEELGTFDVILDTVGSDVPAFRALLKPGGRMVAIAPDPATGALADTEADGNGRLITFMGDPKRAVHDVMAMAVAGDAVRPTVDTVFPLEDIAAAHQAFSEGRGKGKYVISIG
ncbi:NADP-dependent oxidoreductase [Streptomyces sp. NPDC102451]|uniref:NADP-dependent oxidoreductase n=1 Tax=Streptomyces sp. NPDC102451 TaxID=3366177 RepID=UPI0037FCCB87